VHQLDVLTDHEQDPELREHMAALTEVTGYLARQAGVDLPIPPLRGPRARRSVRRRTPEVAPESDLSPSETTDPEIVQLRDLPDPDITDMAP
jgi:hypothetical protein